MHVVALCYCNRLMTDGFIAANQVERLIGAAQISDTAADLADLLCDAGVWEKGVNGKVQGYWIHDFLIYQPSREQIIKERQQNKLRQMKHRNAVINGRVTPAPDPDPDPVSNLKNQLISKSLASSLSKKNGNGHIKDSEPPIKKIVRRLHEESERRKHTPRIR